jgi:hypothetical protein
MWANALDLGKFLAQALHLGLVLEILCGDVFLDTAATQAAKPLDMDGTKKARIQSVVVITSLSGHPDVGASAFGASSFFHKRCWMQAS